MGRRRAAARRTCAGALLLCGGCTSIQWTDDAGVTRHVGLFAYEIEELPHGRRLRRVALGADLRLSGADAGASLGVAASDLLSPEVRRIAPDDLARDFLAARGEAEEEAPRKVRRGFLWLEEDVTASAAIAESAAVGVRVGAAGRLDVGYGAVQELVGAAVEDDVLTYVPPGKTHRGALLWVLDVDGTTSGRRRP
jgi:hypothetical protein